MKMRTLTERLSEHEYKGSIYKHLWKSMDTTLDGILKSSTIFYRDQTRKGIHVFEVLLGKHIHVSVNSMRNINKCVY